MAPVSDGVEQRPPMALHHQGSDAPSAHRRPGYPLSGCVPAEPDSVSPGSVRLASAQQCGKPPSDTGVMPQKILLYRFPTEKRSRSYPHTLEKSRPFDRTWPAYESPDDQLVGLLELQSTIGATREGRQSNDSKRVHSRRPEVKEGSGFPRFPRFQGRHQNVTKSVTNLVKRHQSC